MTKTCCNFKGLILLFFVVFMTTAESFGQFSDLKLNIEASKNALSSGNSVTYMVSLKNKGTTDVDDITVEIELPGSINEFQSTERMQCEGLCNANEVSIWQIEKLPAGKSTRIIYEVQLSEEAESQKIKSSALALSENGNTTLDTSSVELEIANCDEIFVIVEERPQIIGGLDTLHNELRYPDLARKAGIEGRVIADFVVTPLGNVLNAKVVRDIGGDTDEEALRLISDFAQFKPGLRNGEPVCVKLALPITFQVNRDFPSIRPLQDHKVKINENFWFKTLRLASGSTGDIRLKINAPHGRFLPEWVNYKINKDGSAEFYGTPSEPDSAVIEITATNEKGNRVFNSFKIIADDFSVTSNEENFRSDIPEKIKLNKNYPNPFNPSTTISYELSTASDVRLSVFDLLGRHITTLVDTHKNAGFHSIQFHADQLGSGIYVYRLEAGEIIETQKMILVK